MKKILSVCLSMALMGICLSSIAVAETVTFEFTGKVSSVINNAPTTGNEPPAMIGDLWSVKYSFDTNAPVTGGTKYSRFYPGMGPVTLDIVRGHYTIYSLAVPSFTIEIADDGIVIDTYDRFYDLYTIGGSLPDKEGFVLDFRFYLYDSAYGSNRPDGIKTGPNLIATPPDPALFQSQNSGLSRFDSTGRTDWTIFLTAGNASVTTVPEPSTILLLALGLAGAAGVRRRTRKVI